LGDNARVLTGSYIADFTDLRDFPDWQTRVLTKTGLHCKLDTKTDHPRQPKGHSMKNDKAQPTNTRISKTNQPALFASLASLFICLSATMPIAIPFKITGIVLGSVLLGYSTTLMSPKK
jgi:hypothetical protein